MTCKFEDIRDIFTKVLKIDQSEISLQTSMDNLLHWDSFSHLGLVIEIEKRFAIKFRPKQLQEMRSIQKIIEAVEHSDAKKI